MRRLWFASAAVLMCLAQGLAGWQLARAEDDASGERLLPKDTLVFVTIPDVASFKKEWSESTAGAMFQDAEMQPFLSDVKKKLGEWSQKVQEELGVSIDDLLELPEGEVTFAVMEQPKRKLSAVLMVDYGDSKETVEKLLKKMHEALEGATEHSAEDVNDVEIHTFTFKDTPEEFPYKTLSYFNEDSYLVFGSDMAALKEILNHWEEEGGDNTLAANGTFKHVMNRCKDESGEPSMKFFVNPIGLVQAGLSMAQTYVPQVGMAGPIISMLGFDKLKGWGGATYMATGDFDAVSKTYIYAEAAGVLNVFQFPATELAPPKWVSAASSMYFGGNWNVTGAYQAIEGLVDMFQGRGALARLLDQFANNSPEIHLKKDFLDLLDGKFHVVGGGETKDDDAATNRFFVALAVKDGAKAKKLLGKLAVMDGASVESREFNGETVYEIEVAQADQTMSFAVAEGHFIITNDTPTLEGMLRADGSGAASLADSAAYKQIAKHFPAKASMLSFQKSDTQMKQMYDLLKNAENQDFLEGIDLQKLPPFEVLQKYLRTSGSYTVPDKDGALTIGFQLKDDAR